MRINQIVAELNALFPTFYMHPIVNDSTPSPDCPFLVYVPSQQSTYADNTNYSKHETFTLEYYFKIKNIENEELIENKLNSLGLTFSRSEDTFIDNMFVIYYYF